MPSAGAPSRSPWSRRRLRPRVGKCSTVSMPTLLDQPACRPRAHAHLGHGAVGDVDHVGARGGERLGRRDERRRRRTTRRLHLHGDHEVAARELGLAARCASAAGRGPSSGSSPRRRRSTRDPRGRARGSPPRSPACAPDRSRSTLRGSTTPSSRNARACSARYSGVAGYTNRPPTCVRAARVRPRDERDGPDGRPHGAHHAEQLRRTLAAVRADRVRAELGQTRRPPAPARSRAASGRPCVNVALTRPRCPALPRARPRAPAPSHAGPSASR